MAKTSTTDEAPVEQKRRGRPPKSGTSDTAADNSASFWATCAKIPKEEWGTRASIYLYRREPVINRSGNHYIEVYDEPINEDRILRDHGSGVYRLLLNFRKPGEESGKAIDACVVSILNSSYPPKIEPGDWVDDQKNRNWKWAKQTFPKPPSEAGTLLEAVRVVGEIQSAAKPEKKEPEPNRVAETIDTIRAVKELIPPPTPPQTENTTLNSIVTLMISQQDRAQKQNDALLQLLVTQITKPQPAAEKTSIKEVIALVKDEVLPLVEKLKPAEMIDGITRRSKMNGWQEMLQPAIPVVVDFLKPFAAGLATNLFARAGQPAAPQVNGMAPTQPYAQPYGAQSPALSQASPTAQPQNGAMPPFLNMIAPALLNYMRVEADPGELGEDFASWVNEGFSADPRFKAAVAMARAAGPHVIIAQFKGSSWWMDKGTLNDQPSLAEMEGKFGIFTQAFLNWQPPAVVEEEDGSPEVIDIG